MSNLGSASWTNAEHYEPSSVLRSRAEAFMKQVNWDVLASTASRIRQDTPCTIGDSFSVGHFNLVRQIIFSDGVRWVARLRLPELPSFFGCREKLDASRCMQIEVATMNYLRAKTSIPVPEVFFCDLSLSNDVGAAFILMSYIHGTTADDLRRQNGCGINLFGTPEQDKRFRKQLAAIQVQLASLQFPQIGSLYHKGDEFVIGPEIQTGKGPWNSAEDYYRDLAQHVAAAAARDAPFDVLNHSSIRIPKMFPELMSAYSHDFSSGLYGLANRDLGTHNLLVNNDFEIIGVIDFDGVMAAPIDIIAQFPLLGGIHREPPGHVETQPIVIERIKRDAPLLEEYKNMVQDAEYTLRGGVTGETPIANCLMSDGASLVQGLEDYGGYQVDINEGWLTAYEMLLQKKQKDSSKAGDHGWTNSEETLINQDVDSDDTPV